MKIRNSFVSNSSSSSYIVIDNKNLEKHNFNYQDMILPNKELGQLQFDWEPQDFYDIGSKLNFCAIQLCDLRKVKKSLETKEGPYSTECIERNKYKNAYNEFLKLFKDVCCNELHLDITLATDEELDSMWAYIDHQSAAHEDANLEMFENRQNLINFLLSKNSYIHTDNDNG